MDLPRNAKSKAKKPLTAESAERSVENAEKKHFPFFFAFSAVFLSVLRGQKLFPYKLRGRLIPRWFHCEEIFRETPRVFLEQLRNTLRIS